MWTKITRSCTVLMALLALACGGRGPEAVTEDFYGHLGSGEIEAAIDLLSAQVVGQFGREKIRAGLQETALDIQKKGGIDSLEIERQGGEATSEVALVTATVQFGDGTSSVETLKLVLEDGAWRIQPEK